MIANESEHHSTTEPLLDCPASSSNIYLLRTTQQHHVHLTMMADQKASMLVGVTAIGLSIVLGQIASGRADITMFVFAACLLVTILLAVFTVAPRIWPGNQLGQAANPLFFGDFAQQDFATYQQTMRELLDSDGAVYRAMTLDIHQMGIVLARKYRYLRLAFMSFIAGILITAVTVVLEYGLLK